MTTKQLHGIVHDCSLVLLNVSIFFFFYQTNSQLALIIGALYLIKTLASILHTVELKKEDAEIMSELEKILDKQESEVQYLKVTNKQGRKNDE